MRTEKQAQVGDFIKLGNGTVRKVIHILPAPFTEGWEYELENGMILLDEEFTFEDVLLESEVIL